MSFTIDAEALIAQFQGDAKASIQPRGAALILGDASAPTFLWADDPNLLETFKAQLTAGREYLGRIYPMDGAPDAIAELRWYGDRGESQAGLDALRERYHASVSARGLVVAHDV